MLGKEGIGPGLSAVNAFRDQATKKNTAIVFVCRHRGNSCFDAPLILSLSFHRQKVTPVGNLLLISIINKE